MRVGVLASGAGTNLQAILDHVHGREGVEVAAVGSDKADAPALARATAAGVPTAVFELADHADRAARDRAMADFLVAHDVELVVLAGYMALLTPDFLARFPMRVVNVHPALLPAFPGVRAIEQALEYGVKVFGVTVHFVDDGVDTGPVIAQRGGRAPGCPGARRGSRGAAPARARAAVRRRAADLPRRDHGRPEPPTTGDGRAMTGMPQVSSGRDARSPMTQPGEVRIRRALLSVSDKTGVVEFARGLDALGVELVSTGGTAASLREAGLAVRNVDDFTGFPEIMGGRVKTLHPKLYAGVLALRDDPGHMAAAEEHEVEFVDLVCVNLYPFEAWAGRRGVTEHEVLEHIDIGGPTMIRAAAKNFAFAAVVVKPESYDAVLQELREADNKLSLPTRENLAAEAFAYTARYDTAISRWFAEKQGEFPELMMSAYEKVTDLSYGENPHQRAAYYSQVGARMHVLSQVRQRGGKELSFNNVLDINSGRLLVQEFEVPACVIIKHNNPCGVAVGGSAIEAYRRAFACDPQSAFGGVICFNRPVDEELAQALLGQFIEVVLAPGLSDDAVAALCTKPNLRILEDEERRRVNISEWDLKRVMGGLLVQDRDLDLEDRAEMEVVSERKPSEREWGEMLFAWKVCKHVRSNAIVLSRDLASVGIGAGQMSRVDSVRLAIEKASATDTDLTGGALASDAFFPFSDGPQLAVDAGVTAVIQPGGSVRDHEVVEAADAAGISMVFTHRRHFRH